jgi:hypothetical protein
MEIVQMPVDMIVKVPQLFSEFIIRLREILYLPERIQDGSVIPIE